MSDEGKGRNRLLNWLSHWHSLYIKEYPDVANESSKALQEIKHLIQQKPEIDDMEKYVEEKAKEIFNITRNIYPHIKKEAFWKEQITQIISDARGKQVEVDEEFIKKHKFIIQDDFKQQFTEEIMKQMLTEARVKFKK